MSRLIPVILLALSIGGCHKVAEGAATPEDGPTPVWSAAPKSLTTVYSLPSVPFRTLLRGVHLIYEGEAQNAVIRSEADWAGFLSRHAHNEFGPFELDFSQEQGVLVQLGPQPTGMIKVEIVAIEERADQFVVHAVKWLPEGDLVTDDIGYPTHYVAMRKSEKPVTFAPLVEAKPSERPGT